MAGVTFPSGCTGASSELFLVLFVGVSLGGGGEEDVEGAKE